METWKMCYMCFSLLGACTGFQLEKRILIHAFMGRSRTSHFQIISKLARGLADNGYFVDIALSLDNQGKLSSKDSDDTNDNTPNIGFKFYDSVEATRRFLELNSATNVEGVFEIEKYSKAYPMLRLAVDTCQCMIGDSDFINDVTNKSYQLIIGGTLDPCHVLLADILNVENLVNINYALNEMFDHWLFPVQSWDKTLPVSDKIDQLTEISQNYNFMKALFSWYNEVAKEMTGIDLSFDTFLNPAVWLLNSHSVLDGNRLLATNMVEIGGLTSRAGKPLLKQDIDRFIREASDEGCIVFSVNTVTQAVNSAAADKFSQAFGRLPVRVVWKHASKSVPGNIPNNTMVITWMEENDMNDVLAYDNIKAFLTTGGRTGLFEAIYHGIPVICFPLYELEHSTNCDKIVRRGFGKVLDIAGSSEKAIYEAIMDVLSNERYKMSASRWSSVFHSFPMSQDTAILRIINVLENGADTLSAENQQILLPLPLVVDIIFFFLFGVSIFCIILGFLYQLFAKSYFKRKSKSA